MDTGVRSLSRARAALAVGRRADALAAVRDLRGRRPPVASLLEGEALVGLLRNDDALAVTRRGLLRLTSGDLRARLRLVRGEALRRSGEGARGAAEARRALDEAAEPLTLARAHEQLAGCEGSDGELEAAWELYDSTGHAAGLARLTGFRAARLASRGEVEPALRLQWRRIDLARETTRLDLEAEARCDAGDLLRRLGRWEEAARELDAAAETFRTLRDPRESAVAGRRRAMLDLARCDLAAARRALERGRAAAGSGAPPVLRATLQLLGSDLAFAEGDHAAAEAAAGEALGLYAAAGSPEGRCWARVQRAHARISLGDPGGGAAEARRALAEGLPEGAGASRFAELALGRAALRQGRRCDARDAFARACAGLADPVVAALGRLGLALAEARHPDDPAVGAALERLDAFGERRLARLGRADVEALMGPGACATPPAAVREGEPDRRAALLLDVAQSAGGGGAHALDAARRHLPWRRLARVDRPGAWLLEAGDTHPRPLPAGDPLEPRTSPGLERRPEGTVVTARIDESVLAVELPPGATPLTGLAPDLLRVARALVPPPEEPRTSGPLVAGCEAMRRVLARVELLAAGGDPVHVFGETGTGKEGVARSVHDLSRRPGKFVPVNSAGLNDELFQSELFGHVRGAFTGAGADRAGLVEEAEGGTLFLDEVADLSPRSQARLLRFLESGEYVRLGESRPRHASVRVVSAANVPLAERVAEGSFREDLWYRLAAAVVRLPPLRERGEDVLRLARHFLEEAASERRTPSARLSAAAERDLLAWHWPGNVRELRAEVRRAALEARHGRIGPEHLSIGKQPQSSRESLQRAQTRNARRLVQAALADAGGNRTRAALALGISRQALLARIRKLGL